MLFIIIGVLFILGLVAYIIYIRYINKYFAIRNFFLWFLAMVALPVTCFILGAFFLACGILG